MCSLIQQVLQDRVGEARSLNGNLIKVGREIVDFHGEMVLLENYSALNYTGTFQSFNYGSNKDLIFGDS